MGGQRPRVFAHLAGSLHSPTRTPRIPLPARPNSSSVALLVAFVLGATAPVDDAPLVGELARALRAVGVGAAGCVEAPPKSRRHATPPNKSRCRSVRGSPS